MTTSELDQTTTAETSAVQGVVPVTETHTITVTNVCQCVWCPTCDMHTYGDTCEDCDTPTDLMDYCYGCYADAREHLASVWRRWVDENPTLDGYYRIVGSNMGWQHLSAFKDVTADANLSDSIGVNGSWTQTWTVEPVMGGRCEAVQSHHDSIGEHYVVTVAGEDADAV